MTARKTFFTVHPVAEALRKLFEVVVPLDHVEKIAVLDACGRTLAESPLAVIDQPAFVRSTMDGYAVRAADTFGASSTLPAYLTIAGEVRMGQVADQPHMSGQAILIHTGAMLPAGADAVVMVERTQRISDQEIEVLAPVAPGENVLQIGEDVRAGNSVLRCGHRLRPQDIGGLLACGIHEVQVAAPLRIAVMSSGDELVPALEEPAVAQIRDINLPMLTAFCQQMGADVLALGIAPDRLDEQVAMASAGLASADVLIMSAGSSVSVRDLTTSVINQLGEPGVLVHGLAVKPGKPTILACCGGKPVIGLPGNPVSALLVARQILPSLFAHLSGASVPPKTSLRGILTQNISSVNGREDTVPVSVEFDEDTCRVQPIAGKSSLIFTLLQADGVIEIPLNAGGLYAGTEVEVMLF